MNDLIMLDALELRRYILARDVSVHEVVKAFLQRIEEVNPAVNAVVTLCADSALRDAEKADRKIAAEGSERLGALFGMPVLHKDTHSTRGVRTTFGSPCLPIMCRKKTA